MQLLEVKPLAGLNAARWDLPILCRLRGISYFETIRRTVTSVEHRVGNLTLLQESA